MSNARLPLNHDRAHLAPNLVHTSATSLKCIPTVEISKTQIKKLPVNISLISIKQRLSRTIVVPQAHYSPSTADDNPLHTPAPGHSLSLSPDPVPLTNRNTYPIPYT